jgi:hypothetical protein
MAQRRSSATPPKNETYAQLLERTLPLRDWVVTGHVTPDIRGRNTYQLTVHARTAPVAVQRLTAALARRGVQFYLHRVANASNVGGFGVPRNAMGPA